VDFDAPDKEPVDLVFALLVPEESTEEHLQVLANIARYFGSGKSRDALRVDISAQEACELLCQADAQASEAS
jgi:PTS system nitrogen regulatory IIA component